MISELIRLITGKTGDARDADFVEEVTVKETRQPSRAVERLILVGWAIIIAKCFVVAWAIERYAIPVQPGWVIVPTLFMAAICTALYYWKD
ncbi:MAG TPA: hypothetical protein VMM36_11575 [Opitutaceae bacterium]|nr:hypothetical protein [Opitutaceae bacterium]